MRIASSVGTVALVLLASACRPPALGGITLFVDLIADDDDGGMAVVSGNIERLDECRREGTVLVEVNGELSRPSRWDPWPQCSSTFAVGLPYADDGGANTLGAIVWFDSDVGDEQVEVNVVDGLPHRFVDLTLDHDDDVLARGSRHEFEVRPALVGEHTAMVALQREQPMPPVTGTWLTPSSFEYAVSPTIVAGRGVLEVEVSDGPRACTTNDGRDCTITTTTFASRGVQIVVPD